MEHSATTAVTVVETTVAISVVEARPPEIAKYRTKAVNTTVSKSVEKARLPGIAQNSASTESVFAVSSGEAGSSWSRASGMTSTLEMEAVAETVDGGRPLGIAKHSATTAASAFASTVAMLVGEARPSEIAKHDATTVLSCRSNSREDCWWSSASRDWKVPRQRVVEHDSSAHSRWMCQDSFWRLRSFVMLMSFLACEVRGDVELL